MECINCGKEYEAKRKTSKYCSDQCRVAGNRNKVSVTDEQGVSITPVSVTRTNTVSVTRTRTTGCKTSIPGDEDYKGVCYKDQDGKWQASGDIRYNDQKNAYEVGPGSTNSTQPIPSIPPISGLTRQQLESKIRAYPSDQWINSPEHKELMRRLCSKSESELEAEGYSVPIWKVAS